MEVKDGRDANSVKAPSVSGPYRAPRLKVTGTAVAVIQGAWVPNPTTRSTSGMPSSARGGAFGVGSVRLPGPEGTAHLSPCGDARGEVSGRGRCVFAVVLDHEAHEAAGLGQLAGAAAAGPGRD